MSKPTRCRNGWRIRWNDHVGVRRSAMFTNRRDAELALIKYKYEAEEIRRGLRPPPCQNKLFNEVAEMWLKTKAIQKRSYAQDECMLRVHLVPFFGTLNIKDITQFHCDQYINSKTQLSKKTIHNQITLLISLLNHAHRIGWIIRPPELKKPKSNLHETEFSYLQSREEISRFLIAAKNESDAAYFLYFTAIHTGLRAGELAGLHWEDVNFEERRIRVQKSYNGPTKSSRVRYLPIFDALLPLLQFEYRRRISSLLFPNSAAKMHQKSSRIFQETLHRVLDRAGFPMITRNGRSRHYIVFHDLRHTFASKWVMSGGDIFKLQLILGHSSISMTMRYAHLRPSAYIEDYGRFGAGTFDAPYMSDLTENTEVLSLQHRQTLQAIQ